MMGWSWVVLFDIQKFLYNYTIKSCVYRLGPCSLRNPSPAPSRARKGPRACGVWE